MMTRGTVWFVGVIGVAALWGGAVAWKARPIERQIAQNAVGEIKRRGLDRRFESLALDVRGRDLSVVGTALTEEDRKAALDVAAATPGVGTVAAEVAVAPEAKPFVFRVTRNAAGVVTLAGAAPGPEAIVKLGELGRALFGRQVEISLRMARGAPAGDWYAAAKVAVEVIALVEQGEAVLSDRAMTFSGRAADDAALDTAAAAFARSLPQDYRGSADLFTALDAELRGGPLAATAPCQTLIDKVMTGQSIRFAPATAALRESKPRLFERLAQAARRCSALYLQIHAASDTHAGDPAANMRLGEARARALAGALAQRGVARERVAPLGRLRPDPRYSTAAPEIEFRVSETAMPVAKPFVWQIQRSSDGNVAITGNHPTGDAAATLAALTQPLIPGTVSDASREALGAPPGDWPAAARLAVEAVAALETGTAALSDTELSVRGVAKDDATLRAVQTRIAEGVPTGFRAVFGLTTVLDEQLRGPVIAVADLCQALVEAVARTEGVEFVFDGSALYGRQRQLFERLATAMARCPGFAVEIGGHTSGGGDPEAARALSERWAQAVAEAMLRAGTERPRLRAVGYGNARPVADIATEAGRQRNRRIVFRIVS